MCVCACVRARVHVCVLHGWCCIYCHGVFVLVYQFWFQIRTLKICYADSYAVTMLVAMLLLCWLLCCYYAGCYAVTMLVAIC